MTTTKTNSRSQNTNVGELLEATINYNKANVKAHFQDYTKTSKTEDGESVTTVVRQAKSVVLAELNEASGVWEIIHPNDLASQEDLQPITGKIAGLLITSVLQAKGQSVEVRPATVANTAIADWFEENKLYKRREWVAKYLEINPTTVTNRFNSTHKDWYTKAVADFQSRGIEPVVPVGNAHGYHVLFVKEYKEYCESLVEDRTDKSVQEEMAALLAGL